MTTGKEQRVRVLFRYFSTLLDEMTAETMWAIKIDERNGIYQLDNIPFFGPLIAPGDEFSAIYDEDEQILVYRETVVPSGNSIVQIVIIQEGYDLEILRKEFSQMGCASEANGDVFFAMEIPYDVDYAVIVEKLQEFEERGILEYAEPCLSEKHAEDAEID